MTVKLNNDFSGGHAALASADNSQGFFYNFLFDFYIFKRSSVSETTLLKTTATSSTAQLLSQHSRQHTRIGMVGSAITMVNQPQLEAICQLDTAK